MLAGDCSRAKELLMPHDKAVLEYRGKLDEFEGNGWRIGTPTLS